MTPHGLALECERVIEFGLDRLCLVVPGPPPRGARVRLDRTSRKRCPMGEVMNWQHDPPRTVALFDALEVLAWLAARGLVQVETQTAPLPHPGREP